MSGHTRPVIGAICGLLVLLCAAGSRAEEEGASGAGANGAVALRQGGEAVAGEAPGVVPAASDEGEEGVEDRSGAPAGSESEALGVPNGWLSARPMQGSTEKPNGHALARLDPRENELSRVLAALAVVLGLLFMVRVFLKRAGGLLGGGGRPSGVVEVLARYPIARGQSLVVLKLSRRVLLVHQTGSSMTTLSEVTDADEVSSLLARMEAGSRAREAVKFRSTLKTFQAEHERLAQADEGSQGGVLRNGVEVVDLTRGQIRGLSSWLGKRRATA